MSNIQNAVLYLKDMEQQAFFENSDAKDNICEAIKALEKQKKKRVCKCATINMGICPNCEHFIRRYEQSHGNIEIPHCKWCGQALEWE